MAEKVSRKVQLKKRGQNILFKLLFSRTMITILMLIVQVMLLFGTFGWMGTYSRSFLLVCNILAVVLVVYIINTKENPAFKLAWMIPICAFPIFGVILFVFIMVNPGTMDLKRRLDRRKEETKPYLQPNSLVIEKMEKENAPILDLAYYLQNTNQMPAYAGNKVTYFRSGEEKFEDLLIELEKAEKFIFLEYFIINKSRMWSEVLDILKRKVEEGVEVRVMYDGMCTLVNLPYHYTRQLEKFGMKAKVFSPIRPLLSSHQNSRDHRKIFIIDGKVVYNGGVNLADEYINEINLYGHWKDCAVKIEGDAVKSFTAMFLEMWNVSGNAKEDYKRYLNIRHLPREEQKGYVIPYNDDPTNREDVAEDVYLNILFKAKRYVHIMTPYLIIDHQMEEALMFAAKRGVEVVLILPHIPDKKVAFDIARTYYMELLAAGVKIYEYEPGFLHAKVFVADDEMAVVGTINLDYRSLFEHFECATFIYGNQVIYDIEKDMQDTMKISIPVTPEYYRRISLFNKLRGRVFRIFGSLM